MGHAKLNSVNELEMKQGIGKTRRMMSQGLKVKEDKAALSHWSHMEEEWRAYKGQYQRLVYIGSGVIVIF